jgi:hypothetical protein
MKFFEVTTSFNSSNNYGRLVTFNPPIYSSDVVLVYRLAGSNSQGDVELLLKPIILVMEQWILAINLIIVIEM